MKQGFRGYVASRDIEGCVVPQHVQNLVIRNFLESKGYIYKLSATEYCMNNCFMIFKNIIEELNELEGVALYSMFMLPTEKERRMEIYVRFLEAKCKIGGAVEGQLLSSVEDIEKWEKIFDIKMAARFNDYREIESGLYRFY